MTLQEIATGAGPVPLRLIGGDRALATEVQQRLSALGLLDPPADGAFGPVSCWALDEFLVRAGMPEATGLDRRVADALLSHPDTLFPLQRPGTLAGRITVAMERAGMWIARHPDCVNIVYVEGLDLRGLPNANEPDAFNDTRFVLRVGADGVPRIQDAWEATSEPGRHYTVRPMPGVTGAARIAFGQYKAWAVGVHLRGNPSLRHEALVQVADIRVHRDVDKDFRRAGDRVDTGVFAVNQHHGFDNPKQAIGRASAGCLVGRTREGHAAFMRLCKADPRFEANHGYRFMTAILEASQVVAT